MALNEKLHEAVNQKDYTRANELLRQTASADSQVTTDQYPYLLNQACYDGQLEFIQQLVETFHVKPGNSCLNIAIKEKHVSIVKYLVVDSKCKPTYLHLHTAIQKMHLDTVKCLVVDGGCKPTTKSLDTATLSGNLDILKYLVLEGGCNPNAVHLHVAIQKEHLSIVKWLVVDCGYNPTAEHLHSAIQRGCLDIVKYLVVDGGCKPTTEHLSTAFSMLVQTVSETTQKIYLKVIKFLVIEHACKPTTKHLDTAIQKGYSDIVKWLIFCKCKPTTEHLDTAFCMLVPSVPETSQKRYLDIVKCLIVDGGCELTTEHLNAIFHKLQVCSTACQNEFFDIVKCLIDIYGCKPNNEHLDIAIQRSYLDIVKCLVVNGGCKPTTKNLNTAIQCGYSIVKWLVLDGGCKPTTENLDTAILCGHFDIVKWLIVDGGCKPTPPNFDTAIQKTHLGILKWLVVDGGCKPTTEHLVTAIQKEHLSIVKWLVVDGGFKPTIEHLDAAIQRGHLDILKYLGERCKLTTEHVNTAIRKEHLDIVKWIIIDGVCKPTSEHLDTAIQYGYLDIVKYLVVDGGCKPTTKHFDIAIQKEHLDIVKLLVAEYGFEPTTEHLHLLKTAIQRNHFDIVKCLVDGGCKPTTEHLDAAIQMRYTDTVKYLVVNCGCKPTTEQLYTAVEHGAGKIAKIIIACDSIDLNTQIGSNQRTVLHIASANGKLSVVMHLVKDVRCNIGEKDGEGNTALHLACYYDHYHIVEALLDTGKCNVNVRNTDNNAPLDISNNPKIIKELVKYGASVSNVYERFGYVLGNSLRQPIKSAVKVFVTGDPSGGKSTLTKSLQKEFSVLSLARIFSRSKKVSDVDVKTAGIIPYQFESKQYGSVTFYDLAGQREFYSSHAAVLSSTICSSPPIFLLVVDLQKNEEELKQSILYWLSFLENQCSSVNGKPHLIVIGSHADILKSRGEDSMQKGSIIRDTLSQLSLTWFEFSDFIPMDCQYPQSYEIDRLRHQLGVSCKALRVTSTIHFNSHCLLIYLVNSFAKDQAITVKQVFDQIIIENVKGLLEYVPLNFEVLCSMCEQLNDGGHILFLRNPKKVEYSWIIFDQADLLSNVTGTVFAPESFKQHCKLASSTGVVPLSEIVHHFPKHNSDMLISFFTHFEFCHEICDLETLLLIKAHQSHWNSADLHQVGARSSNPLFDRYFLFPGLITINRPDHVWNMDSQFSFLSGWMLQCLQPTQFYSSRFLQVLLLRITFSSAFSSHKHELDPSVPALQRKCSIWRNGIHWGDRNGVDVLMEVVEHKIVILLMRSLWLTGKCLQLRSSIISKVLKTTTDICPTVSTTEFFINPSETLQYPIDSVSELSNFSISEVSASVSSGKTIVVSTANKSLPLERLLIFEPYAKLGPSILHIIIT